MKNFIEKIKFAAASGVVAICAMGFSGMIAAAYSGEDEHLFRANVNT